MLVNNGKYTINGAIGNLKALKVEQDSKFWSLLLRMDVIEHLDIGGFSMRLQRYYNRSSWWFQPPRYSPLKLYIIVLSIYGHETKKPPIKMQQTDVNMVVVSINGIPQNMHDVDAVMENPIYWNLMTWEYPISDLRPTIVCLSPQQTIIHRYFV